MQNVQANNVNVETFKKTRLDTLTLTNKDQGYEVLFSFIDAPRQPKQRGQVPTFEISVAFTKQEQHEFSEILEPYEAYIDSVFNRTSARKRSYFKPEKDKISKQPTGVEMLSIKNTFPVKVYDINNNEILPAPRIPRGSKVGLQFGVIPFELNGEHGVAMTRLYGIKVFAWGESSTGGFGASTGEAMHIPDSAKPRQQNDQQNHQQNPAMMNYGGGYNPNAGGGGFNPNGGGYNPNAGGGNYRPNGGGGFNPNSEQNYNPNGGGGFNPNGGGYNPNAEQNFNPNGRSPMGGMMNFNQAERGGHANTGATMDIDNAPNINAGGGFNHNNPNENQNRPNTGAHPFAGAYNGSKEGF